MNYNYQLSKFTSKITLFLKTLDIQRTKETSFKCSEMQLFRAQMPQKRFLVQSSFAFKCGKKGAAAISSMSCVRFHINTVTLRLSRVFQSGWFFSPILTVVVWWLRIQLKIYLLFPRYEFYFWFSLKLWYFLIQNWN